MTGVRQDGRAGGVRRRSTGRTAAVVAAVLGLSGVLALPPGPLPGGALRASAAGDPSDARVDVIVATLEPRSLRREDALSVTGSLVVHSGEPVRDLAVRLRIGDRLDSRSSLQAAAAAPERGRLRGPQAPAPPAPVPTPGTPSPSPPAEPEPAEVRAGSAVPFRISVPVRDLDLGRLGAYPLRIEARGRDSAGLRVLGSADTFLPWFPDGVQAPTRLAWVWPLVDTPRRAVGDVFLDDRLATSLAENGRLEALLRVAELARRRPARSSGPAAAGASSVPVPVTWAVDPELLESTSLMTGAYRVASGTASAQGTGTAAAVTWLARLRRAVRGTPMISLPYADPDLVALDRAGRGADIGAAVVTGAEVTRSVLGSASVAGVAWPPGGVLTPGTLDSLVAGSSGSRGVLLSATAFPPTVPGLNGAPLTTPGALTSLSTVTGSVPALVADATLGSLLEGGVGAGSARLAEQRFLVETAMITAERPGNSRSVLILPPRRWAPDPGYAAALLSGTGSVPWLRPATVPDLLADPPPGVDRGPLRYPDAAASDELPPGYLARVTESRRATKAFRDVLSDPEPVVPILAGLARSESSAFRSRLPAGVELRDSVVRSLGGLRGNVRVATSGRVTLTAATGTIPVTLVNDLDQPVTVRLRLDAQNQARLSAAPAESQQLPPRSISVVKVRASARTAGQFPVYVTLLTPEGATIGPRVELLVRSTAYGRVALGITGGAFVVLLATIVVRLSRRAWRARGHPA